MICVNLLGRLMWAICKSYKITLKHPTQKDKLSSDVKCRNMQRKFFFFWQLENKNCKALSLYLFSVKLSKAEALHLAIVRLEWIKLMQIMWFTMSLKFQICHSLKVVPILWLRSLQWLFSTQDKISVITYLCYADVRTIKLTYHDIYYLLGNGLWETTQYCS